MNWIEWFSLDNATAIINIGILNIFNFMYM